MKSYHPLIYNDSSPIVDPIDVHREMRRRSLVRHDQTLAGESLVDTSQPLDVSWVKLAASTYNISPDIKDYLMVPVILFHANVPNRNGVGFPLKDLAAFSDEYGMQLYKTWKGKPIHYEHASENPNKAKGVVLDTFLKRDGAFWKTIAYLAVDRDKDNVLAKRIQKKELKTYSMGAYIHGGFFCSKCGAPEGNCAHLSKARNESGETFKYMQAVKRTGQKDELVYWLARTPVGFEVSCVESPAFIMAENDNIQTWSNP